MYSTSNAERVKPPTEASKKALFYTKFEGNTAGDERYLEIILDAVARGLPKDAQIGIYIAHDPKSEDRAQKSVQKLLGQMTAMGFKPSNITFWLSTVAVEAGAHKKEQGTALLSQCFRKETNAYGADMANAANSVGTYIKPTKRKILPVDLLVIAGWVQQLNENGANHIKATLKVPDTAKILLCAPPGGYIDNRNISKGNQPTMSLKTALIKYQYQNVYCLQPGVYTAGGLITSPSTTIAAVQHEQARQAWIKHVPPELASQLKATNNNAKDPLIVIYCSKDDPGKRGQDFLKEIAKVHNNKYPVLLIGTNDGNKNTDNYKAWETLCNEHRLKVYSLPRTASTEVLMRGLQDAEYAMATGSFSILEAKKFGIHHCAYLAPPHLQRFGSLLEEANGTELARAFQQGDAALAELSQLASADYTPNILSIDNARASPEQEIPGLTIVTRDTKEQQKKIHLYMKQNMPVQYALLAESALAYNRYQIYADGDTAREKNLAEREYQKYLKTYAEYKAAYNQVEGQLVGNVKNNQINIDDDDAVAAYGTAATSYYSANGVASVTAAAPVSAAGSNYSTALSGSGVVIVSYGAAGVTFTTPATGIKVTGGNYSANGLDIVGYNASRNNYIRPPTAADTPAVNLRAALIGHDAAEAGASENNYSPPPTAAVTAEVNYGAAYVGDSVAAAAVSGSSQNTGGGSGSGSSYSGVQTAAERAEAAWDGSSAAGAGANAVRRAANASSNNSKDECLLRVMQYKQRLAAEKLEKYANDALDTAGAAYDAKYGGDENDDGDGDAPADDDDDDSTRPKF